MAWLKQNAHWLLTLFVAFVFIQSLFFKFSGSPETVYIFEAKLDPWAATLGFPGVFAPGGFSRRRSSALPNSWRRCCCSAARRCRGSASCKCSARRWDWA